MAAQEINSTTLKNDANLQAYYRMESNTNDTSSNAYNLTQSGSPTFEAGQFGNAIKLVRASSQYASITNASAPNLNISSDITVYSWVKTASNSGVNSIAAKFSNANTGYILYTDSSGRANFTLSGLTTNTNVNPTTVLSTGSWYQIVGTYNHTSQKLSMYINGAQTQVSASGSFDTNSVFFAVGGNAQGGGNTAANFFDGDIDDVAVFNRELVAADILALYNGTYGKTTTGGAFLFNMI